MRKDPKSSDFAGARLTEEKARTLQIPGVIPGALAAKAVLCRVAQRHEQAPSAHISWLRCWPVLILAGIYIYLLGAGFI